MKTIYILIISLFLFSEVNGQCHMDRHSTNFYDGWVSASTSVNPNGLRADSHWIMYDFDQPYFLSTMQVWNANDPDNLDFGMRDVVIDYSMDGITWTELGFYTFDQGTGKSIYEGEVGPDFGGVEAQYVLITGLSNYGGANYGLSEVKINVIEGPDESEDPCLSVDISPNPYRTSFEVTIKTDCSSPIYYSLSSQLGLPIQRNSINEGPGNHKVRFPASRNLGVGVYYLEVTQDGVTQRFPIVKMDGR